MTVRFRQAGPQDAVALRALHSASWRRHYAPYVPEAALGVPLERNMDARWGTWPADRAIFLAETAEGVLGFIACAFPRGAFIDNLHVAAHAQGQGVGAALFAVLAKHLLTAGYDSVGLSVLTGNGAARAFYARLGGHEGDVQQDTLLEFPVTSVPVVWGADALHHVVRDFHPDAGKGA